MSVENPSFENEPEPKQGQEQSSEKPKSVEELTKEGNDLMKKIGRVRSSEELFTIKAEMDRIKREIETAYKREAQERQNELGKKLAVLKQEGDKAAEDSRVAQENVKKTLKNLGL